MHTIPLEFEGSIPLPKELNGYDCRICMVLQRSEVDETHYVLRTHKDERLDANNNMVDYCDILTGEGTICLPDHHYAHADHSWAERVTYAEMLEVRLPADEYQRLDVNRWRNRPEVV